VIERENKKIVFVAPPLSMMERYGVTGQSGGRTMPTGLACLAAVTRSAGYSTKIVDAEIMKFSSSQTADKILAFQPDYVGFTAVTISIFNAAEVAALLKKNRKDIICVIGGHHFSALPEETLKLFPSFDIGIIGEGEATIGELLNNLNKGLNLEKLKKVKGIIFRKSHELIKTEPRERIKDLDSLPMPAWDLLPDIGRYYCPPVHTVKKLPATNLVTSRGCPGKCIFCARNVYGSTLSCYSASRVMEIIRDLYFNYGVREIQFRDDEFLAFRKRLKELCQLLINEKLDLVWSCTGRVDFINPKVLDLMKKAGCWQIWYGIESGSQKILDIMKKGIDIDDTIRAIKWTKESGIDSCGFFIIGNPGETRETLRKTINFALRLGISECHAGFMTPFPGCELYETYKKYGTFENDWRKLHGWIPVFVPYGLTRAELKFFSNKFHRKFYFRLKIIWSYIKKIRSFKALYLYLQGFFALIQFTGIKEK